MSIANDVEAIIERRKGKVEQLQSRKELLEKIISSLEKLQAQKERMLNNSGRLGLARDVWECINSLDIYSIQMKWGDFCREYENVKSRFSRDTINIAVVGGARQGKSKLLQTISGLDDKVIPAFTTTDCTGATSMLKNAKGERLRADITFRTEREMIESVQAYLDKILGKNVMKIGAFQEIRRLDLEKIKHMVGKRPEAALLKHLSKYVEHFDEWSKEVSSRETISITDEDEIKKYVAQHNGKDEENPERENYYKYLAVKKAEISCEFNFADAGKIVLQDTIGLGDTSLGIEEAMLDTIAKNSDAAIIVKRPEQMVGKFDENDYKLYEKLSEAFAEKNMGKWLFWLINETNGVLYGDNHDRCVSVKKEIAKWDLAGTEIVDVSSTEQVNDSFLPMVLSELVRNMDSIDEGLVADLGRMADSIYLEYEKLRQSVGNILTSEVKAGGEVKKFMRDKWNKFYYDQFMKGIMDFRNAWRKRAKQECQEYRKYIEENILNHARELVPNIDILEHELSAGGNNGEVDVYKDRINKLRTEFTFQFLDIDEQVFDLEWQNIKEKVVDLFTEDDGGRLKYVKPIDENRPKADWIAGAASDDIFKGADYVHIRKAFQVLDNFRLSVRGFLMDRIRQGVYRLQIENSELRLSNRGNAREQAEEIWKLLDREMKEVCEEIKFDMEEQYAVPYKIFSSVIEEFYDRICFSSTDVSGRTNASDLWKDFYEEECGRVWSEEFQDVKERSEIYREWESVKEELEKYTREDFIVSIATVG